MLSLVIHAWAIKVVILQKMHICGSNFNIRIQGDKFFNKIVSKTHWPEKL